MRYKSISAFKEVLRKIGQGSREWLWRETFDREIISLNISTWTYLARFLKFICCISWPKIGDIWVRTTYFQEILDKSITSNNRESRLPTVIFHQYIHRGIKCTKVDTLPSFWLGQSVFLFYFQLTFYRENGPWPVESE